MNRTVWRAGTFGAIGLTAAGVTAWSLYVVAHDIYGVPAVLAAGTSIPFDGAAVACLSLAAEATRERRSALGPHCATLGLAAISIYLNRLHALHIHGGTGAFLLFAAPTVALLVLAGLSWSATRARLRAQQGDTPAVLPRLGFWSWTLAPEESWKRTKDEVLTHVTGTAAAHAPNVGRPVKPRTASDALREHFADLAPDKAIRLAHSARPDAAPAELAAELALYGVHVSAVQVALVLGHQLHTTTVDRPDTPRTGLDAMPTPRPRAPLPSADNRTGPPDTAAEAARRLVSLGFIDKTQAVPLIMNTLGLENTKRQWDSVRRAFDRALDNRAEPQPSMPGEQLAIDTEDDGVGKGGGGYA
ncbi:DUF2637 domain-containing protein [Streptomyces sp. NPDC049577]|uniref:DUF2637 domain-containing protein n=1 Tax=Streptomyces sp. NPDC049577 TaxID=3155153 RepID=UPI00341B4F5B